RLEGGARAPEVLGPDSAKCVPVTLVNIRGVDAEEPDLSTVELGDQLRSRHLFDDAAGVTGRLPLEVEAAADLTHVREHDEVFGPLCLSQLESRASQCAEEV